MLFTKTMPLNDYIDSFYEIKNDDNFFFQNEFDLNNVEKDLIFTTQKIKKNNLRFNDFSQKQESYHYEVSLDGKPIVMNFQNIFSYMGGAKNIWNSTKDRLGLKTEYLCEREKMKRFSDLLKSEQSLSDGKIECYTYEHGLQLACERIFKGYNARKIYQGTGPFYLKFKDTPLLVRI